MPCNLQVQSHTAWRILLQGINDFTGQKCHKIRRRKLQTLFSGCVQQNLCFGSNVSVNTLLKNSCHFFKFRCCYEHRLELLKRFDIITGIMIDLLDRQKSSDFSYWDTRKFELLGAFRVRAVLRSIYASPNNRARIHLHCYQSVYRRSPMTYINAFLPSLLFYFSYRSLMDILNYN